MAITSQTRKLGELVTFKTGKLDSNAAVPNGDYPFFTCSQETLRTNTFSFDTECVILAGNNANGIFPLKYFKGQFDAYQRTYVVRPRDTEVLTAKFLYYALRLKLDEFRSFSTGAATKFLTLTILNETAIQTPSLPIQRRIAGILSAYDDLIENSQRRIRILESMARALYREALSTGNEAAATRPIADSPFWRFMSENVNNYAGTKRYYATADIEGLAVTGAGIDYSFADKPSRAQKQPVPNSVWFARMKETYKIAWFGPQEDERVAGAVLSSGFAGFEARDAELWPLLFLTVSSMEFHVQKDLYCTGATQMSLTNEGMARIKLPIPAEQSARRLGREAGPMLYAIASLQRRNDNLRRTRDLLLPRLLSGQIALDELEAA
jgi:type I restriction enzyme S subunit